jgi:hypothetical protein
MRYGSDTEAVIIFANLISNMAALTHQIDFG